MIGFHLAVDTANLAFSLFAIVTIFLVSREFSFGALRRFFLYVKIAALFYALNLALEVVQQDPLYLDRGAAFVNLPNALGVIDLLNTGFVAFVLAAFLSLYLDWKRTRLDYSIRPPKSGQEAG